MGKFMRKYSILLFVILLICIIMTNCTLMNKNIYKDIINQNNYVVTFQEKTIHLKLNKSDIIEDTKFNSNDVIVYETENETIWLKKVDYTYEDDGIIMLVFTISHKHLNLFYGTLLSIYSKDKDESSFASNIHPIAIITNEHVYKEVKLAGFGSGEQFSLYIDKNDVNFIEGTFEIEISRLNEISYKRK